MTSHSIDSVLRIASLLFNIIVVFRLIQLQLHKVYPVFLTFLCIPLVLQTIGVLYGPGSLPFLVGFAILEPIRNVFYILVVWELFDVIFRNYAGLRSLSRWAMGIGAVIAPAGLILTIIASSSTSFTSSRFVRLAIRFERGITFGLVIFIVIMLYFISRYPIKLPRNSLVLVILYGLWFLGDSAVLLSAGFLSSRYRHIVNDALSVLEVGSYLGWAVLLSKDGECRESRIHRHISPENEKILIGELVAMNGLLLRAARSISQSSPVGY
jgi:hypothetical protein